MNAVIRYPRPPELDQLGTRHAVVEASAGTGKTFLLEHLIIELLLDHNARMEEIWSSLSLSAPLPSFACASARS